MSALQIAMISATALIISTLANLAVLQFALQPLRDLSTAVVDAAGKKINQKLPNPNTKRYEENGFSEMLMSIYSKNLPGKSAKNNENSLISVLNQTSAGIIALDKTSKILFSNSAAPVSLGSDGEPKIDLIFDDKIDLQTWLTACRQNDVRAQKTWLRVPNKIVGQDERRIFDVTANFEQGATAETVIVAHDRTEFYQPEDEDLDFISFAAHELRGPITVIRGYLDVLLTELNQKLEPEQKELFQRLIVSGNRLSGYINNILNTSRYDRRHLKLQLAEDSVAAIYETIRGDMELRASSQRRRISVDIPQDLPTVAADHSSVSEVMSNLIDNAIKYSNEGGTVFVKARTKSEREVEISVIDTGIGIPASIIENLFHKFYRSHRSRETVAGTGIGLYICKAIVESHGGTIGVSSAEGQGSTFTFTLPIYATVATKLKSNDNSNTQIISTGKSWIKNHSKFTSQ